MSVEGGVSGMQQRRECPNCGKIFFAWRPDTAPGAKVKCYFCKHEFEDEATRRPPPPAPPPPAAAEGTPAPGGTAPPTPPAAETPSSST